MCAACREMKPKTDLIRVVRLPEGGIAVDRDGKLQGRGAYVCRRAQCIARLKKNGGLNRGLKTAVDEGIYEELEREVND